MRVSTFQSLRLRAPLGRPKRLLSALVEILLLGGVVVLLEALGPRTPSRGSDLAGFLMGGLLVIVLVGAARVGRLPWTRRAAGAVKRAAVAAGHRLAPPAGVAFRLPHDPPPALDEARRVPTFALLMLAGAAAVSGDAVPRALTWMKTDLSYTLFLAVLGSLWALFGTVTIVALLAARASVLNAKSPAVRSLPLLLWLVAVIVAAWSPGWVVLAVLLAAVLLLAPSVLRRPAGRYFLYRREKSGGFTAVTIDGYLRSAFLLVAAFLLFTGALAQAPRLRSIVVPSGAYALTLALGLSASVGAVYLVLRAGLHVRRLYGPRGGAPENPLVPTLWWPGGDGTLAWVRAARERGWRIVVEADPPPRGFDLVVGSPDDPRCFRPVPEPSLDDALFRLERRYHVVMRRLFHRRFQSLVKAITALGQVPGCGYLFCPFAWPVRGVVRDTGGVDPDDPDGRPLGGALVGHPYESVFPLRLRRYLHGVFRALDVDVLYWENRVTWADLRRVTGVLFETYDQRRFPALDRHFVGLGRIRVVIQEPEDGDEPGRGLGEEEVPPSPPPLRARVLVVRRDDGGREVEVPDAAPSTHQPEPVLA